MNDTPKSIYDKTETMLLLVSIRESIDKLAAAIERQSKPGGNQGNKPSATSRPYTKQEVTARFLSAVASIARDWAQYENKTRLEVCLGTAFSILVLLDGENGGMPAFTVAPNPHPDDRDYRASRGENWFPEATPTDHDIAGALHDEFLRYECPSASV